MKLGLDHRPTDSPSLLLALCGWNFTASGTEMTQSRMRSNRITNTLATSKNVRNKTNK